MRAIRCDECRGRLGMLQRRYWRMRFCSKRCREAYIRRLHEDTRKKIAFLQYLYRGGT